MVLLSSIDFFTVSGGTGYCRSLSKQMIALGLVVLWRPVSQLKEKARQEKGGHIPGNVEETVSGFR